MVSRTAGFSCKNLILVGPASWQRNVEYFGSSMWPVGNGADVRVADNSKRRLSPAAQKTDPLAIQAIAASDVNQINVCGHCPHTLI